MCQDTTRTTLLKALSTSSACAQGQFFDSMLLWKSTSVTISHLGSTCVFLRVYASQCSFSINLFSVVPCQLVMCFYFSSRIKFLHCSRYISAATTKTIKYRAFSFFSSVFFWLCWCCYFPMIVVVNIISQIICPSFSSFFLWPLLFF